MVQQKITFKKINMENVIQQIDVMESIVHLHNVVGMEQIVFKINVKQAQFFFKIIFG